MTLDRSLAPGDIVQITDDKGRHHTLVLAEGAAFHTHRGAIAHDDLIGRPEGIVVKSTGGTTYVALRSLLEDFVLSMPRGAAVIYPKDAARIAMLTGLRPGWRVLEAGAGSGALTCTLLQTVGETGRVESVERRADFAETARANVRRWFGGEPEAWQLHIGDFADRPWSSGAPFDALVLDMLDPWEHVDAAAAALRPGGVLVVYVATTTQLSRIAEDLRSDGRWTEPRAEESLVRTWHLEGLAVRPDHRMIGHTGFLLTSRRLAEGTVAPPRRRRPAKAAATQGESIAETDGA
ncbi:MAG: tRNA (adenine-N1)-methyltransferase [Candidatus Nanopelagicales bacterium]|jgi:tRNA (adenine57-N1/adenine58-N1)-methyltransferase